MNLLKVMHSIQSQSEFEKLPVNENNFLFDDFNELRKHAIFDESDAYNKIYYNEPTSDPNKDYYIEKILSRYKDPKSSKIYYNCMYYDMDDKGKNVGARFVV